MTTRTHPGNRPARWHELQRATTQPPHRWWRRFVGVAVFIPVYVIASTAVTFATVFPLAATGHIVAGTPEQVAASMATTPLGLVALTGSLIALIPAVMAAQWVSHRLHPGFVFSVAGRMRWRYLATMTGVAGLLIVPLMVASVDRAGPPLWPLAATALLVMPLQAAGEEVVFRGWLLHSIARARNTPAVAATVTSLLFAAFHIANGAPSGAAYTWFFITGVAAVTLSVLTGGLEAAIGLHAANNTAAMVVLALAGNNPGVAFNAGTVGWSYVAVSVAVIGVYTVAALWLHHRWGLATRTVPAHTPATPRPQIIHVHHTTDGATA